MDENGRCSYCGGPLAYAEQWLGAVLVHRVLRCRWCLMEAR